MKRYGVNDIQTARETLLRRILTHMDTTGIHFDLPSPIRVPPSILDAIESGRGVIVLMTHDKLNFLTLRYLHDLGLKPMAIATDPKFNVYGTNVPADAIAASPTCLVRARTALRAGRVVCAMVDWFANPARALQFHTARGQVAMSDATIRLAAACNGLVAFSSVRLDGGRIVGGISEPLEARDAVADVTTAFMSFVTTSVSCDPRSGSNPNEVPH